MPQIFLEDFVRPDHLNGNGTVKFDVNTAYAANAFGEALRRGTIQGAGPGTGPFGWPPMYGGLRSPIYYWGEPVNWTRIGSSRIESMTGKSVIYTGHNFRSAGKYEEDEYGLKSIYVPTPYRSGLPDPTGVTVHPTQAPVLDMVGCQGNVVRGIGVYGQKVLTEPGGTPEPNTIPGIGTLIAGLERAKRDAGGTMYWDGTGGEGGSNNNTFEFCDWLGWFNTANLHLLNAIITTLNNCGIQMIKNSSTTRGLACTQLPLSAGSVAPVQVQSGMNQSAFYPHLSNPNYNAGHNADQRMLCTQTAAGALVLENTEIHSMYKDTYPGPGQSNIAAPILLHKVRQFSAKNRPFGHDGVLGMVEVYNFAYQLAFEGIEFWNSDRYNNSKQAGILWLNNCRYPQAGEEQEYGPLIGLDIRNCTLNGQYQEGTAYIRGGGGSTIINMDFDVSNNIRGDVKILDLNANWPNPSASFLEHVSIWCKGSGLRVGGSLSSTVRLASPGPIALSPGGVDNSKRF